MSDDQNVESVRQKLESRAAIGLRKYGVTTERGDVDLLGWCKHLQEELLDAAVYLEAAMGEIEQNPDQVRSELAALTQFIDAQPHDQFCFTNLTSNPEKQITGCTCWKSKSPHFVRPTFAASGKTPRK